MNLYAQAGSPIPPPPDFWGEVSRLAGLLLPAAAAWIVSVTISLWLWFKFLRDQYRRGRRIRHATAGHLDAVSSRSALLITATVAFLQLAWLFLTWLFVMDLTWIFGLEKFAIALQWNSWTATYLLVCCSILTASYAAAFGAFQRPEFTYPAARTYPNRGRYIIRRLRWLPLIMPAIYLILGALYVVILGVISLTGGQLHGNSFGAGLFVLLFSLGYATASWGAVAAPLLVQRTWRSAHMQRLAQESRPSGATTASGPP